MDADLSRADLTQASMINTELMATRLEGATWIDGRRCTEGSVGACRR